MNIAPTISIRSGFRRMGSRYGSLIDPDRFMGLNPWEGLRLTPLRIAELNIKNEENLYNMEVAVPGFRKEELDLEIIENLLIIKGHKSADRKEQEKLVIGEFEADKFERSIALSPDIDKDNIIASYQEGLLKIQFQKLSDQLHNNKIALKVPIQ